MMKSHYYESITFEVEQGLKKPEEYYDVSGLKDIFHQLFKKRKQIIDPKNGRKVYLNQK